MKLIPLTQGQFAQVSDEDYEWISTQKWFACWDMHTRSYYARRQGINGKAAKVQMHREVLHLVPHDGKLGDHINGNTLDNRRENLRVVTNRQNGLNRRSHREGKLPGAYFDKRTGRWTAKAYVAAKSHHIGVFGTQQEAYSAYAKFLTENLTSASA